MNRLGPLLMQRLDQLLEFVDFNSSIELDYLQIARCLEEMRQRCCRLDRDLQGVQEQLRQSESERLVLEVKLKHARNQVEVEMKKRHGAEAALEKQERKLKLIYDYLMADPQTSSLSVDQCSAALAVFDRPHFSHSTLLPGKRCVSGEVLSAVQELGTSILSDISFDHSDDEIDLGTIRPVKGRDRGRSSLAPLIQPVVAAKRARPSAGAISCAKGMRVSLKSEVIADNRGSAGHSLIPIAATSHRRSQSNRWPSTNSDLTTIWGSTDDSAGGSSQAENDTETGPKQRGAQDPFTPSPPQGTPTLQQHHFTSRTVIRLEYCAVCKSRLRFGKIAFKCRPCQLLVHPECKEQCQALCTPNARPRVKEGILADFAPLTPPLVPPIVIQCVTQVEKRGLQETGLYRVPGAEHLVHEWKNKLLSARRALPSLDHVADVNVICGILKDFLRSLKEPLVTFYLHSAFLHAAEIPDESARHAALCHVVMKLPLANRDTLAFLMLHLHRIIQSPECRMDQHSLARIFGPTLVGHSIPNPTPVTIMEDTPRQCLVDWPVVSKIFFFEEGQCLFVSIPQASHSFSKVSQKSCILPSWLSSSSTISELVWDYVLTSSIVTFFQACLFFQVVSHLLALPLKFWKRFVREEQENLVPSVQQTNGVNEQEQLSCLLSSPKINASIQMSPGSGCLPSKLCDCIGTTFPPLNGHRTKKTGKILALPK